jgi:hypothetical protein
VVCSKEARSLAGSRLLLALQQIYIEHNTLDELDVNTHNYLTMEVEYTRATILNFILEALTAYLRACVNGFGLSFILLVCAAKALHERVQHTYICLIMFIQLHWHL